VQPAEGTNLRGFPAQGRLHGADPRGGCWSSAEEGCFLPILRRWYVSRSCESSLLWLSERGRLAGGCVSSEGQKNPPASPQTGGVAFAKCTFSMLDEALAVGGTV
jgi:hypothetical protein